MRVVFMGTPDISAVCLEKLLAQHFSVVGVYTKPDAPQNRGMRLAQSPVKKVALAAGLPVFQPERLRDPETVQTLRDLHPDVIAVVAYGKILPPEVLEIPPRGCINIHASILPALRGSGPVQWAILQGMTETGVTAMYMAPEMDAGDVIAVSRTPIDPEENAQSLLSRLAELGGELLCGTLHKLENGPVRGTPQDHSQATFAPMLTKAMCPIDWRKTPLEIKNHIRGLDPWPVATMTLGNRRLKVYAAVLTDKTTQAPPGTPLGVTKTGLEMACANGGVLEIRRLQAEGGKVMAAADYFRGHPLET